MLKSILFFSSLFCTYLSVDADAMIGPGTWKMLKMERVKNDFDIFEFNIVQRKYNRTHDMFQGSMNFHEDLDDTFGVLVDVCKHVDGGCKQYMLLAENIFSDLIGKYALDNFEGMLRLAGVEDPKFPVPKGEYKFSEYMWDWDKMPEEGPYGQYTSECCAMKGPEPVGCLSVEMLFQEDEEDYDE